LPARQRPPRVAIAGIIALRDAALSPRSAPGIIALRDAAARSPRSAPIIALCETAHSPRSALLTFALRDGALAAPAMPDAAVAQPVRTSAWRAGGEFIAA